jgi:hypothetical protein
VGHQVDDGLRSNLAFLESLMSPALSVVSTQLSVGVSGAGCYEAWWVLATMLVGR